MKLLYKRWRLFLYLTIGLVWIFFSITKNVIIDEPLNTIDYLLACFGIYYLGKFIYQYRYQYLTVTQDQIIKHFPFYSKSIEIQNIDRFYRNKVGDYVIEAGSKKIRINPIIVEKKSLEAFKDFTNQLQIKQEVH